MGKLNPSTIHMLPYSVSCLSRSPFFSYTPLLPLVSRGTAVEIPTFALCVVVSSGVCTTPASTGYYK